MYKELIISVIIVICVFLLDYRTQQYTEKTIKETIAQLEDLKSSIISENGNDAEKSERINNMYEQWLDYHEKLAFYIEHDELEKVETNFVTCKSFIESAEYELALSELERTVFVLDHINDKYSFNLENIF